ncbi:MAG: class I SAM-dependent methyltransferase [Ilumatobacter sp.]
MSSADAERWDARHAATESHIVPAPPDALVGHEHDQVLPTSGRALDVACGRGAQSVWLAQLGLDVVALDASPTAIRYLTERATHIDEAFGRRDTHESALGHLIDARIHDLDAGLPHDAVDLDVIICQRFRQPSLYAEFVERLAVGGIAVVTVLSETGTAAPGPFHAPPGELASAFDRPDTEIVRRTEGHGQESIVVRRIDSNRPAQSSSR